VADDGDVEGVAGIRHAAGLARDEIVAGGRERDGLDAARDIAVSNLTASARNAAVFMFARLLAIVSSLFSSVT
jgi:hypothetical protein